MKLFRTYGSFSSLMFFILLMGMLASGCKSFRKQKDELPDNRDKGTLHVSADESFKPIIDQFVVVYESQHLQTKILVDYKPEAECI